MQQTVPFVPSSRRGLILHDTLAFLALLGVSIALFGITLFLFKSFQAHRAELATRWSGEGRTDLARNQPEQAVGALRTALSYESDGPNERADQRLLAQALDAAGHTEEATSYFLNLHDAAPGDGSINLALARLARRRDDASEAVDFYRAAIYGSWEGDAPVRRRQARLELADYLIERNQLAEARNELFTVASNYPGDVPLNLEVAAKLESAGFLDDALTFYGKAAAASPHSRLPLERAGAVAFRMGRFGEAERLLNRALQERPSLNQPADAQPQLEALAACARRIQQLDLTRDQPAGERAEHILTAAKIAEARLHQCQQTAPSPALTGLATRWAGAGPGGALSHRVLLQNAAALDTWAALVYTTEQETAPPGNTACGAASGDDALLLRLANAAQPIALQVPAAAALPVPSSEPSLVRRIFGAGHAGAASTGAKSDGKVQATDGK